jgi:outer membrane protein assembly factor BamB
MRCPNPVCRKVFEVQGDDGDPRGDSSPSTEPPRGPQPVHDTGIIPLQPDSDDMSPQTAQTGAVGDSIPILEAEVVKEGRSTSRRESERVQEIVPLLPAELAEESKPAQPRETRSWHQPPPVRTPGAPRTSPREEAVEPEAVRPSIAAEEVPDVSKEPPEETPPPWQSSPPAQRSAKQSAIAVGHEAIVPLGDSAAGPSVPAFDLGMERQSTARRRALWIVATLVLVAVVFIGTFGLILWRVLGESEEKLYKQALRDYEEGRYNAAASEFRILPEKYPKSDRLAVYELMRDLSEVRDRVYVSDSDPQQALESLHGFLEARKDDTRLKEHKEDVYQTFLKLVESLVAKAVDARERHILDLAVRTFGEGQGYQSPEKGSGPAEQSVKDRLAEAGETIARHEKRVNALLALTRLTTLPPPPSAETVKLARDIVRREGLSQDPEALARIGDLYQAMRKSIHYVSRQTPLGVGKPEALEPSLLVVPALVKPPETSQGTPANRQKEARQDVFLALVRGVLYALDQDNGDLRWATRVGIDTTNLPVRLPATAVSPELFLVISADRTTLMALEAQTGKLRWQHQLGAACLGRPVIVGSRAYVPTYTGQVLEIETVQGNLLGYFELGQTLSVGGVWQEGTDYIYFPGDSEYVYVLDIALTHQPNQPPRRKDCVAVLHTGHPSGSLRSEPILVSRVDPFDPSAWTGFLILCQAEGLEHMRLRVFNLPIDSPDSPPLLQTDPIHGWSWFRPYHDSEKLAFVTDQGVLGLFGINQIRNQDRPLFPEFVEEKKVVQAAVSLGRAQVVHAVENDFWVVANGELQRLCVDVFGQRITPRWPGTLNVGSPLHAGQFEESSKTLFLVTQDRRQISMATAVNAQDGKVLWQRQLGVESQGDALVVGNDILLADRGGGLVRFEAGKEYPQTGRGWKKADSLLARPLEGSAITAYLLPAKDGVTVYEIAAPREDKRITVRIYQTAQEGKEASLEEKNIELTAPLAGPPALGPSSIFLPLADGTLGRLLLPLGPNSFSAGPDWRSGRADFGAVGYVVHLGPAEFLTTDGSRTVTHWKWPLAQGTFQTVPPNPEPQLARIVAPPIVLSGGSDAELRVCVADSEGNVALLQGPGLKPVRLWTLGGKITEGPFLRGQQIGCVVDKNRVVWIDPGKDQLLWQYRLSGEGIVGQPRQIGDVVVVADLSGQFIGLDVVKGLPRGKGYMLHPSAAPAAAPVPFGPDQAFVPLTDGTIFLLPLNRLRVSVRPSQLLNESG